MNRRNFLKSGTVATAGITILNFPIFGREAPSNKVIVAVMGTNSRGAYLARCFSEIAATEVGYICDVEETAIANGLEPFAAAARKPKVVKDIRELVAKKDFDALIIAAPDHWHAPAAILGVTHGKHVYVEKPCSHNPAEGELLLAARKKYPRQVIQMGNQRRSFPNLKEAVRLVKEEKIIGDTYLGKSWYSNNRESIGRGKVVPVPSTLDFELWQGPAPRKEFRDNLVHYNWHWFWNWGTGESNNNGLHEIDCCRWFLGVDFPSKVNSSGGRYAFDDDWETTDTQIASFEFGGKASITWEGRSCNKFPVEGGGRGFMIYGTNGTLLNKGNDDYQIFDAANKLIRQAKSKEGSEAGNIVSATGNLDFYHFNNFLDSIRGNAQPASPIEEGHTSNLLCHLANISQRTGRTLHCDPRNGHILNDNEAMGLWKRDYQKGWEPQVNAAK